MSESIHQRHDKKFFHVFYKYIQLDWMDNEEPCMCLGHKGLRKVVAFVPISLAHLYADSKTGDPTPYLLKESINIARAFGISADKWNVQTIAEAIVNHLPDLLKMPPKRQESTESMIETAVDQYGLGVSINGEKVIH